MATTKTATATQSRPDEFEALRERGLHAAVCNLRAASWNADDLSVDAVLSTERAVTIWDWDAYATIDEVLRADGVVIPDGGQAPLLDAHMRWSVDDIRGSVRAIQREGDQVVGQLRFAKVDSNQETITKVREGHLTDVSVGYRVLEAVRLKPGETQEIKGRTYKADKRPLRVATKWELKEVSLVPVGADAAAKMRADDGPERMIMETARTEPQQAAAATPTPASPPAADPVRAAAPDQATLDKAAADAVAAERKRLTDIREMARDLDLPPEVIERAEREQTVEQARQAFLDAVRSRTKPVAPGAIVRSGELTRETLAFGLAMQVGAKISDAQREIGHVASRMNLLDICRHALRLDGIEASGLSKHELAARAATTASLPVIFGNVADKALIDVYTDTPSTAMMWMGITEVADFKAAKRGRLADVGTLQKLNNAGEIQNLPVAEWFESINVDTYAGLIHLTRADIINDDLGAFADLTRKCAAAAKRKVDDVAYTVLLSNPTLNDGTAMFHATATTHNNLMSGGTTTLTDANLATMRQKMRQQVDVNKAPLNLDVAKLIVPPELEHTARKFCFSGEIRRSGGSTSAAEQYGPFNPWYGTLQPVIEPRLSNSNYTGYSTTAFYTACDPLQGNHMMIAFLRGTNRAPLISLKDPAPNQTGMVWQVLMDVGAAAVDFRGVQKSAGA